MAKNEKENRAEEDRVLGNLSQSMKNGNVAAVVVEPITVIGNHMATPYFYK